MLKDSFDLYNNCIIAHAALIEVSGDLIQVTSNHIYIVQLFQNFCFIMNDLSQIVQEPGGLI